MIVSLILVKNSPQNFTQKTETLKIKMKLSSILYLFFCFYLILNLSSIYRSHSQILKSNSIFYFVASLVFIPLNPLLLFHTLISLLLLNSDDGLCFFLPCLYIFLTSSTNSKALLLRRRKKNMYTKEHHRFYMIIK